MKRQSHKDTVKKNELVDGVNISIVDTIYVHLCDLAATAAAAREIVWD